MDKDKKALVQHAMAMAEIEDGERELSKERNAIRVIISGSMKCVKAGVLLHHDPPTPLEMATALKAISTLAPLEFRARAADVQAATLQLAKDRLEFDRKCREEDQAEMRRKNEVGGTAGERALEILAAAGVYKQGLDPDVVSAIEAKIRKGE